MSDEEEKGIRAPLEGEGIRAPRGAVGEILSVTFGRPEAPGKPGRILIEVCSERRSDPPSLELSELAGAHDRMPMLGIGDVVELRYLGPAAKRARKKQQDPKEGA